MKPRTPHELVLSLGRWQSSLTEAAAKIPCAIDGPVPPEITAELRKIRGRIDDLRRAQDRRWMEAVAADDLDPRQKWARDALARMGG